MSAEQKRLLSGFLRRLGRLDASGSPRRTYRPTLLTTTQSLKPLISPLTRTDTYDYLETTATLRDETSLQAHAGRLLLKDG